MGEASSLPEDGHILFYRRDRFEFGFLSHFYASPIELDGEVWPTVEHFYQTQKSLDPRYRRAIRASKTPGDAKRLAATPIEGRKDRGSWFYEMRRPPRTDWMDVKRDVMRRGDAAKFLQHHDLAERLLATGDAEIVEDSPHDAFWGVGKDELGENWAGKILMEVRTALSAGQLGLFLELPAGR